MNLSSLLDRLRVGHLTDLSEAWETTGSAIQLANGDVGIGYEFIPPDLYGRSFSEIDDLFVRVALDGVLRSGIENRDVVRFYVQAYEEPEHSGARYLEEMDASEPLLRVMAEETASSFELESEKGRLMRRRYYLTVRVRTGRARGRNRQFKTVAQDLQREINKAAESRAVMAAEALKALGCLSVRRLDASGLFNLLRVYYNPSLLRFFKEDEKYEPIGKFYSRRDLRAHPELHQPTLREKFLLSHVENSDPGHIKVGSSYVKTLAMASAPRSFYPNMSAFYLSVPGPYWLMYEVSREPQQEVVRRLEGVARRLGVAAQSNPVTGGDADIGTKVSVGKSVNAIAHALNTNDTIYRVRLMLSVIGRNLSEVQARAQEAASIMRSSLSGAAVHVDGEGVLSSWSLMAPLGGVERNTVGGKGRYVHDLFGVNAKYLLPVAASWVQRGDRELYYRGRSQELVGIDPFDRNSSSWNAIIAGTSGSGKTFFVKDLITQLTRHGNVWTMIIDQGLGYIEMIKALGGSVIQVTREKPTKINPFDLPPGRSRPNDDELAGVSSLIRTMVPTPAGGSPDAEASILAAAIRSTYERLVNERLGEGGDVILEAQTPTISDLYSTLRSLERIGTKKASAEESSTARNIATRLLAWTKEGPYGRFVDGPTEADLTKRFVYYEMSGLSGDSEDTQRLSAVMALLVMNLAYTRMGEDARTRKLIVIDEAWKLFKLPAMRGFVEDLYRRSRKYNAAIFTISQGISDFAGVEGLINNSNFRYLLRMTNEGEALKRYCKLNDHGIAIHNGLSGSSGSYREIMLQQMTDQGSEVGVFRFAPTRLGYWVYTSDPSDAARREEVLKATNGDFVRAAYLLAYGREGEKWGDERPPSQELWEAVHERL